MQYNCMGYLPASQEWGSEGYHLWLITDRPSEASASSGQASQQQPRQPHLHQLQFVKSALALNPCAVRIHPPLPLPSIPVHVSLPRTYRATTSTCSCKGRTSSTWIPRTPCHTWPNPRVSPSPWQQPLPSLATSSGRSCPCRTLTWPITGLSGWEQAFSLSLLVSIRAVNE